MRKLTVFFLASLNVMWLSMPLHAAPAITAKMPKAGKVFSDCATCPQMVVIPAGSFAMGSPETEEGRRDDGDPVHRVTIAAFAIGRTEITRGQFAEMVKKNNYTTGNKCWTLEGGKYEDRKGRGWRDPAYKQDDKHPVTCVNWDDAQVYANWLSAKAHKQYRLPTEAEWEYAARGNTVTARYWGENPDEACAYANAADKTAQTQTPGSEHWTVHNCTDGFAFTAPVGSFKPNAFGLYDMLGNVWEWTEDSYHDSYKDAPIDGSAWQGDGAKRVIRGGSWYDAPQYVRSAGRDQAVQERRYNNFGFRVVRVLP
jgi:formylglycine-generating enzyme required for sulfatase activity